MKEVKLNAHIIKPDHDPEEILGEFIATLETVLNGEYTAKRRTEDDRTENGNGLIFIREEGELTTEDGEKFSVEIYQRIRLKSGHVVISTTEVKTL